MKRLGLGMGMGSRIGRKRKSWWANQTEVLFFGEISKIRDGKLYNQKTGATDYLIVGGSVGNYTFQCPNTADYIAADTDHIWFKSDGSIRAHATYTSELIGYDLQSTPVKYDDVSPNTIRKILILKSNLSEVNLHKLYKDFRLPVFWNGTYKDIGYLKSNRTIDEQYVWIPELIFPNTLVDTTKTVSFYDFTDESSITKVGTLVSKVNDKSGNENHIYQSGADSIKPTWDVVTGLNFDGVQQYIRGNFILTQPEYIYIVYNLVSYVSAAKYVIDGYSGLGYIKTQSATSVVFSAGIASGQCAGVNVGTFILARAQFKGATSKGYINTTEVSGNYGTEDMGGIIIGGYHSLGNFYSNIQVKELIIRKTIDDEAEIVAYLKNKYSI